MVVLNVVLMALIGAAIVGLLVWSICTQHRHFGCADLRIRRRLSISVRLVTRYPTELAGRSYIGPEI